MIIHQIHYFFCYNVPPLRSKLKLFVIFEDDANNSASSAFFLIPEMTFQLSWRPGANIRESKLGNIIRVIQGGAVSTLKPEKDLFEVQFLSFCCPLADFDNRQPRWHPGKRKRPRRNALIEPLPTYSLCSIRTKFKNSKKPST